jgi:hypothetical protein
MPMLTRNDVQDIANLVCEYGFEIGLVLPAIDMHVHPDGAVCISVSCFRDDACLEVETLNDVIRTAILSRNAVLNAARRRMDCLQSRISTKH